ncbi:beta strand repeat-containing protein, partial [Qipengyuania sphaerica]|uniref:beta strand repeat-containing protein n=1 Tax=Qipengyuania sphaerica TaxID=2867243 RepID=UPI001FFCD09F
MDSFETGKDFAENLETGLNQDEQGSEMQGNQAPARAMRAGDMVLQPDADGRVVLPEGASLENMSAQGRDLVIVMEDGTRIIIPEGAIIVPQIVVDGVTVPAANLAALLTGNEPQPAAGNPQSSGGDFEQDPGNIQDAYAIGNLLPYTELQFPQPEEEEVIPYLADQDPVIVIETPDSPAGVINAIATVDEDGLPVRTVDGVGEPQGTRSETNSEKAAGTIVFSAPDGVDTVSVNGVNIIEDGVPAIELGDTITGDSGFLTITSIDVAIGEIGFTFTLTDNLVAVTVDGSFMMTVTDIDGDTSTANLQINVIDDNPIARDDVDEVEAGTFGPIFGNVVLGNDEGGADESGADGYGIDGTVTGYSNDNGAVDTVGDPLVGEYGVLTIDVDGNYVYDRFHDTPGDRTDVFTYTIVDGDGTPSEATLTIYIGDAPPVITKVPTGDDATVVDEDQLPPDTDRRDDESEGSEYDGDDETVTGVIEFTSLDGVSTITIGDVVLTAEFLNDEDNFPFDVISDETGTLTITDYTYDPVTGLGTITYIYTLTDNTSDDEETEVTFPLVVTDLDGDPGPGELKITIVDDNPEANDDPLAVVAEDSVDGIGGNVMTNDIEGADGANVTAITVGDQTVSVEQDGTDAVLITANGTYTIDMFGNWTFVPVPGLDQSNGPVDASFTYTITEGPGGDDDADTAVQPILITDGAPPEDAEPVTVTVDDQNLADGSTPATPVVDAGVLEFTPGSDPFVSYEFSDDLTTLGTGLDWVADGSTIIRGYDNGRLVVTLELTVTDTNQVTVTATLEDNYLGHSSQGDELDDLGFVNVVATDIDGDTATGRVDVDVSDDVPTANDDPLASVAEDAVGTIGGNVMGNDTEGADAATVTAITVGGQTVVVPQDGTDAVLVTANGTYTIDMQGTWTFDPNPGLDQSAGPIDVTFTYTLTDTDGDVDMAEQPIEITDGAGPPNPDPVTVTLDDQNLADGSTPAAPEQDAGVLAFTEGSDAFESFTFATDLSTLGGNLTWTRVDDDTIIGEDNGRLVVTLELTVSGNNATVTATLDDNYLGHSSQGDELDDLGFVNVIATDIDGDTATGRVDVDVSDDIPEANDYDGAAFAEGSGAHVIGDAATLLGIDGNADGLDGPLQDIVFTPTTSFGGSLEINGAGELVYTSPTNVTSPTTVTETFTYTVTDSDGDTVTREVTFDVTDTGISNVGATDTLVDEDNIDGLDGNPGGPGDDAQVTTGTISYTLGADALDAITLSVASTGLTTLDGTAVVTSWDAGTNTLTGYAQGDPSDVVFTITLSNITAIGADYTVTLLQPVAHPVQDDPATLSDTEIAFEDNLSFTVDVSVTDVDDSEGTTSFTVTIDDDTPIAGDNVSAGNVDEGGSIGGSVLGNDSAGADGYADEGPIVQVRTLDGSVVDAMPDGNGNYVVATTLGTLTINRDGSYTYESNPNSTNVDTSDVFIYTIRDADGDEAEAQLTIGIDNVAGDVFDDDVLVNEAGLPNGSDSGSDSEVDADGQITVQNATGPFHYSLVGGVFSDNGTPGDTSDDTYTIDGTYGTIVLNASTGAYTYTLDTAFTDTDMVENTTNTVLNAESFEYEVRDASNNLITNPLDNNEISVNIIDDVPSVAIELDADADVVLDESGDGAGAVTLTVGSSYTAGNDPDVAGSNAL